MFKNMKFKKIIVQNIDDSISLYEGKILVKNYKPQYDFKKSYEYFDHITSIALKKFKFFNNNNLSWSLESLNFQPMFWHVSFNTLKYKDFFDKYGFNIPSTDLNENVRNSYNRACLFLRNDSLIKSLVIILRSLKSYFFMFVWVLINVLKKKKNKIWIDKFIITDYRYNHPNLKKIIHNSNYLEILNRFSAPTSHIIRKNNFIDGLEKEILKRISGYKLLSYAIKFLKPKKIIVRDDLDYFQGILLAAKLNKIKIIGVGHGVMYQWASNIFGPRSFCVLNPIIFDKIYVWHSSFKDLICKKTTLYHSSQIKLCGWLQKFSYDNKKNNNNGDYVLYPFEHHTDYISIKKLLLKFIKLGKKIVIKKYPGWKNYSIFENINIEFVDDFSDKHLNNVFVIVALGTTMIFEFISRNYLVIYPEQSGYHLYEELNIPGLISDKEFFNGKEDFNFDFKLEEITDEFQQEFI